MEVEDAVDSDVPQVVAELQELATESEDEIRPADLAQLEEESLLPAPAPLPPLPTEPAPAPEPAPVPAPLVAVVDDGDVVDVVVAVVTIAVSDGRSTLGEEAGHPA